jgi:hypothetical protein
VSHAANRRRVLKRQSVVFPLFLDEEAKVSDCSDFNAYLPAGSAIGWKRNISSFVYL